jgi:hypothetical protein
LFSLVSVFPESNSIGYISSLTLPWYSGGGWDDFLEDSSQELSPTAVENTSLIGFSLGLIAVSPINRYLSLRCEVLLSAQGGGYTFEYPNGDSDANLISEINLGIPFSLKVNVLSVQNNVLYLFGGLQMSALLSQAEYAQQGAVFNKTKLDRDDFSILNFSWIGGIGVDVPHRDHIIFLELSYLRETDSTLIIYENVHQNVLKMSCGIRWVL